MCPSTTESTLSRVSHTLFVGPPSLQDLAQDIDRNLAAFQDGIEAKTTLAAIISGAKALGFKEAGKSFARQLKQEHKALNSLEFAKVFTLSMFGEPSEISSSNRLVTRDSVLAQAQTLVGTEVEEMAKGARRDFTAAGFPVALQDHALSDFLIGEALEELLANADTAAAFRTALPGVTNPLVMTGIESACPIFAHLVGYSKFDARGRVIPRFDVSLFGGGRSRRESFEEHMAREVSEEWASQECRDELQALFRSLLRPHQAVAGTNTATNDKASSEINPTSATLWTRTTRNSTDPDRGVVMTPLVAVRGKVLVAVVSAAQVQRLRQLVQSSLTRNNSESYVALAQASDHLLTR